MLKLRLRQLKGWNQSPLQKILAAADPQIPLKNAGFCPEVHEEV